VEVRPAPVGNAPDITVLPSSFDYGNVTVGGDVAEIFEVRNDGTEDLIINSTILVGANSAEFSITSGGGSFTLIPGASQDVEVTFSPTSLGAKSATLRISSDDPDEDPFDVPLSGNGVAAPAPDIASSPTSHDYGDVVVNTSASQTFVISNAGSAVLSVTGTSLIGADAAAFNIDSGGGTFNLAPGDTHHVVVSFNPIDLGTKSATLQLASDDPDENPFDIPLTGNSILTPVPDIAVTPSSFDYGNVFEGTSASQTFVVDNTGQADLNVSGTSITGGDAGEFSIDSGGAPFTVAPGGTHDVVVSFNPTSTGLKTAALSIASDDPDENPLDVALSGTGEEVPAGSGQVVFEEVVSGGSTSSLTASTSTAITGVPGDLYLAAMTTKPNVSVSSVAGLGLTWTEVAAQCSGRKQTGMRVWLAQGTPSGSDIVTATFASQPSNGAVVVTRYSGVDQITPIGSVVTGNSNGESGACGGGTDSNAYSFNISTTAPGSFIFGAAALRNKSHTPGAGYIERLEFAQGSGGNTAGLAIQDMEIASISTVALDGTFSSKVDWAVIGLELRAAPTGPAPDITVLPSSHDYGDVVVTTSSAQTFEIRNDGDEDLTVNSTSLVGADASQFAITSGGGSFTLIPGASQNMDVTFTPSSLGGKSATLRISSNDPDEDPFDVALAGNGVSAPVPDIASSPTSHDYGDVVVNTSSAQLFVISNVGSADLNVSSTSLAGTDAAQFSIDSGAAAFVLSPGDTHHVSVSFNPDALGAKSATLQLVSDDPDENPFDIPLTGNSIATAVPDIAVTPTAHDYGNVFEGSSASQTFVVDNTGLADLNVSTTSLAGADAGEFSIDSGGAPFTLTPGSTRDVVVSFNPTSTGLKTATLSFASDDPDENPLDVDLSGTGTEVPAGGGEVVFEEAVSGGSSNSITVSTIGSVTAVSGHLYIAAISMKPNGTVTAVTGLGLTWTEVASQCSGRNQTGVKVWLGQGTPGSSEPVSAAFASAPSNGVITVVRYSGADLASPIGNVLSGNTNGASGACSGGTDNASYSFNLATVVPNAQVINAIAMRNKTHTPGAGYVEQAEVSQGSSGSVASVAVMDMQVASPSPVTIDGTFSGSVDWAMVGLELRPAGTTMAVRDLLALASSEGLEAQKDSGPADPDATTLAATTDATPVLPEVFELKPNYPNPFNPETRIAYALPVDSEVKLIVYNSRGQKVRQLIDGFQTAGFKSALWNGRNGQGYAVSSGVYFIRLEANHQVFVRKVLMQK